jgi:hypothetical protein
MKREKMMKTAFLWAGALTLAIAGPVAADPGKVNPKGKGNEKHSTIQPSNKARSTAERKSDMRMWADGHRPPDQVLEGWQ